MALFSHRKIKLEAGLYARLVAAAQTAGYATVDEFIGHSLEQAAERIEAQSALRGKTDQQQMNEQLRGLGYLE